MRNIEYIAYTDETIGSLSLRDVCRYMKEHQFNQIELIDVNRIQHLNEIEIKKNNVYDIQVEVGIEVMTNIKGISIIALGVDKNRYEILEEYLDTKERDKQQVYRDILNNLKDKFSIELDEREILLYAKKDFLNLVDIARLLYRKGYVTSVREGITHYLNLCFKTDEEIAYKDAKQIIDILKDGSREVYYYYYDNDYNDKQIQEKLQVKKLPIRVFENHQIDEI